MSEEVNIYNREKNNLVSNLEEMILEQDIILQKKNKKFNSRTFIKDQL